MAEYHRYASLDEWTDDTILVVQVDKDGTTWHRVAGEQFGTRFDSLREALEAGDIMVTRKLVSSVAIYLHDGATWDASLGSLNPPV